MAHAELKDAIKSAADTVARYVKDAATLTVRTELVEVGTATGPTLAAETTLRLDGDSATVIPAFRNDTGRLAVDTAVHELHMEALGAAIDYRTRMLDAMLGLLRG